MGVKKTVPEHGDRVRWVNDQGEWMGTIIDLHANKTKGEPGPNFGVMPDDGPRRLYNWPKNECVVLDDRPKFCPRCGEAGHRAQSCQAEYLAWKSKKEAARATTSNQVAQQPTPQAVATTPAPAWDVDF